MFDSIVAALTATYPLDTMFDQTNLRNVHYVASLIGAVMALYVMQLWTVGSLAISDDCFVAWHGRRFALLFVALSMLWSLSYQDTKGWMPWPSDVALSIAVDLFLLSSIIVAFKKKRLAG